MRTIKYLILSVFLCVSQSSYGSITNEIAKELKGTAYSAQSTTVKQAQSDHDGTWLNCIQYAIRIKEISKDAEIWQTSDKHAIAIIKDEKGKRIAYSNGRKVKESSYSKIRRIR